MNLEEALNTPVSIEETSMAGTYRGEIQDDAFVDDVFAAAIEAQVQKEKVSQVKVDMTDYTIDKPYIKIETKSLLKVLSQLSPIINLGSQNAVSRGITLRVLSNNNVEAISPNELYYYKATLECETDLEVGTAMFLDYQFLQKISKFIPPKTLIYKDVDAMGMDIYHIRLLTDDLELIGTTLIKSDLAKLEYKFSPTDTVQILEPKPLLKSLNTLANVIKFESDSNKKLVNTKDGKALFKTSLLCARSNTELFDISLKVQPINYIIKTISLLNQDEKITIKNTDSAQYKRYAICTDNSMMIAVYSDSMYDINIDAWFNEDLSLTPIDYMKLKYQLDYANSITYAKGNIQLTYKDGQLTGGLLLSNGNLSPLEIPVLGNLNMVEGTSFRINAKTLLSSLNSLDPSSQTLIGYKDGLFYLANDDVTIVIVTLGASR